MPRERSCARSRNACRPRHVFPFVGALVEALSVQIQTFTKWWNSHLKERNLKIDVLFEDVKSGVPFYFYFYLCPPK